MQGNKQEHVEKEVIFGDEARQRLLKGVETLARAVTTTLGPRGRNVIIEDRGGKHVLTKDGVTVARAISLRDPYANMGCQLIREAAQRTNDVAGDGTTTATTLAYSLFAGGMKLLASGHAAVEIKKGIDIAVAAVIDELKRMAIPVDDDEMVVNVGAISANGEVEIGELLAQVMREVGRDGVITVEEAKGLHTNLEIVEGARFDRGYFSTYFVSDADRMVCELDEPLILISNLRFSSAADVIPLLEVVNQQQRSLLIIADEVEGELLQLLVTNHMRGVLRCCAIKAPAFGEQRVNMLHDIATIVGGKLITAGDKLNTHQACEELIDAGTLGSCKRAIIDKSRTTFVDAAGSKASIEERADSVRKKLEDPTLSPDERGMLQERLGKLASGVAILHVGGVTEVELQERKYRVEDALKATQAAVEEGIVPGGGIALARASRILLERSMFENTSDDVALGIRLVRDACLAPLRTIVENAGGRPAVIVENDVVANASPTYGYDAANDVYVDVLEAGIIDPVKVSRTALENAASVAGLLLTANALVLNTVEPEHSMF